MNDIKVLLLCWLQATLRFASMLLRPTTLLTLLLWAERREQSWKQDYTNARTSKVEQMKTFTLCLNCRNHSGNSLKLVPCLSWACGLQGSQSSLQTGSCAADPPGISLPPALILREITALGKMVGFCLPNLAQKYSVIICDQQDDTPKGLWFYM